MTGHHSLPVVDAKSAAALYVEAAIVARSADVAGEIPASHVDADGGLGGAIGTANGAFATASTRSRVPGLGSRKHELQTRRDEAKSASREDVCRPPGYRL